ncbi:MAG: BamA/TamA family outer membrane protein [bacterium]|nr:BamA/TamA family outer membrane protein [bacterium]
MRQKQINKFSAVIVFFVLTFMAAPAAFSQYNFYYGKNKVQKQNYKWNHVETAHFKIYYYTQKERLIRKIAAASEQAYDVISDYLNVKVKRKIPMIFYSTQFDFYLNNISGYLPFGVVAFAEPTSYRMVVQGDASFDELMETITHELGHIFEYEILGNRSRYISPPLWFMEGFSDFITFKWDQFSLLTVRDSVLTDRIPLLTKYGQLNAPGLGNRSPYDFGHVVFEFLEEKFGKRGIKKLLYAARGGSLFRGRRNLLRVFDYSPKMFNYDFGKYLRKRFKDFFNKENPEDYSYVIGPDVPFTYSFSHQISPSGELLAILTANMKVRQLQIILISMKDGKVIKNLTPGFTTKYDTINLNFNPVGGQSFAWNKASNQIAFFVTKEYTNYLIVLDVLNGKVLKKIKIRKLQKPTSPVFHPKKPNLLYFTGQESTDAYIYSMNLDTRKVTKHTEGLMFIRAMDIASDGTRIVYSAKQDEHHNLYLATLDNPEMGKRITFGKYNDITPTFSEDGKRIYYSSDELQSYNICAIDLETKKFYRYSDVRTGNFFPLEIPGEEDQVVMSSYYKSRFTLFKKDVSTALEERQLEFETLDTAALARKQEEIPKVEMTKLGKYKPLKKLYIRSLPPLAVSIGTDGGFFGYSAISLSDLLGDHSFSLAVSSLYGYRSYSLSYLNQKHRFQLYANLFAYKEAYYYGYTTAQSLTLRSLYGGTLGFFYPFSQSYRAEVTASAYKQNENFDNLFLGGDLPFGQFFDGISVPLRISLVGETTRFQNYGPMMGHTFKLTYEKYVKFGSNFLDAYTMTGDVRKYFRLTNDVQLAFRLYGYKSGGKNPLLMWTGGNNTFRSEGYRRVVGEKMFLFNAELRLPLIQAALTPIGVIGPIRGVVFFDVGGVWFNGQKFNFFKKDAAGKTQFQLQDAISTYGFGLEFFMFGWPMHVDWVWRTDWKQKSYHGVNFWVGYDF